ncbi:MAG: hypothetical protein CXZ00_09015 [Acidobacteria bacterium]|nr:MAG: hypothetical protein CXZ00_09015 [Acidobacteriota bacterium]
MLKKALVEWPFLAECRMPAFDRRVPHLSAALFGAKVGSAQSALFVSSNEKRGPGSALERLTLNC